MFYDIFSVKDSTCYNCCHFLRELFVLIVTTVSCRSLRDKWEVVCDQLSDTQRKLESCLIQWSSYDENYEQLQKWLLDTEVQLKEDTDMKGTLPDKKAQLQNHRVRENYGFLWCARSVVLQRKKNFFLILASEVLNCQEIYIFLNQLMS